MEFGVRVQDQSGFSLIKVIMRVPFPKQWETCSCLIHPGLNILARLQCKDRSGVLRLFSRLPK
jgi:hypothetical protein